MQAQFHRYILCVACLAAIACLGAAERPVIQPAFFRVDLAPDASVDVRFAVVASPGTVLTAIQVDCACLKALTQLPARIDQRGELEIAFRASGIRPGVESIVVSTTTGTVRAELQIAGPGTGTGIAVLRQALERAAAAQCGVWGIVHDLRGTVRNCGCSGGSLGGLGHLVALPAQARALAPTVATRWFATGEVDGQRTGVGSFLAERGWTIRDPAVVVAEDPTAVLTAPVITAIVLTGPSPINHRRILRPVLTGGLIVDLLVVDAAGTVQGHWVMPVDGTLADDPSILARFPDHLSSRIDLDTRPSATCAACHATAHGTWTASRHARALDSLSSANRTDACIACHTTPVTTGIVAPGVNCQSCHLGSAAHAAAAGRTRTTGATACRTCHDAQHHPSFDRANAWTAVLHALEPAVKP